MNYFLDLQRKMIKKKEKIFWNLKTAYTKSKYQILWVVPYKHILRTSDLKYDKMAFIPYSIKLGQLTHLENISYLTPRRNFK